MLISTWLTAVRNRLQAPRVVKRRQNQKQASQASENLETRALLTTTLQAVRPNVGEFLTPGEIRHQAPQELTLQFSLGSTITPSTITNQSIRVFRSADGILGNTGDVPITVGYVGVGSVPNEVVLRFGENLVDDRYRIVVNGTGANALSATIVTSTGVVVDPVANSTFDFELDLGARIVAVDPQPVSRNLNGDLVQARNQIVLYFNDDDLNVVSAQTVSRYQLIYTNETVSSLDDVVHTPSSAVYSAANDTVTLTFLQDIALLSGAGSYRLRVGNSEPLPIAPTAVNPPTDPGSSFGTANTQLGVINPAINTSSVIRSAINPQFVAFSFPGANDEPGHREIEVENHLDGGADVGDSGIPFVQYNFRSNYGVDPQGNPLSNAITDAQKDRAREVFAYYSEISGLDFVETATGGLTVVTGDMRALEPTIPTGPGGVLGLAGMGMAIMDMAETWDNLPGGTWFNTALHEIGHLLGLGHTYDLPEPTVMGAGPNGSIGTGVEPTLGGDHDIVHMQHMYRPDSVDIDLYRFQTTATSIFSAEVMAERMHDSSTLDSVLRLYREVGGVRELVAQNDNYFSKDSFLELTLTPGVYYIGVSSTGNDAYDPTIQNTGIGGTSQGIYDLRVNFRPNVTGAGSALVDTTGRTFDGDSDGIQGGVYNFWFKTASASDTLFVDKSAGSYLSNAVNSTVGSIVVERTAPFALNDVIRIGNEQMRINSINQTTRTLSVSRGFNSTAAASHSLDAPIRKMSANGSLLEPYAFIGDALSAASYGDVVRIVGNGGTDGDVNTLNDSLPYEIGVDASTQPKPLADGASLETPRGVTVMVDKGAVLKLHRSWLGTGSSTTSVDRSGGALQVLGVPGRQVIMTSWNDETIGTDTTSAPTSANEGDWGGIVFRNEIDRAQNRFNAENEGIFLNYVSNARLLWGGGTVTIDSTTQTINPIHMDRSQPTIVNNRIEFSDDSAMSADPDSFEELTFHSPRFQTGKPAFTVDYKRVGPDINGNTLLNNGNNALFVRMDTVAGGSTQKLTVPGRFNDTDIVHLVAQNLEIQGTPGGAVRETVAPVVTLVTLTPLPGAPGGTLLPGVAPLQGYRYRVVFTDENGFESPASATTGLVTLSATGSVRLAQLPQVSVDSVYTGRRIYRSELGGAGTFTLIADLDRTATTYTDNGVTLQRTLPAVPTDPRDRARLDARLSIDPGIVVKLQGARIEAEVGAQLIAEGVAGRQVIFTSRLDDRYGAGGTFDTNNDDAAGATERVPAAGNWGGLYFGHLGSGSVDHALVTFAGGNIPVGGGFSNFNPVEIHEAKVRIRNTSFERNADGASTGTRSGLFTNAPGTIFVRGAQPILLDNTFVGNSGAIININVNALNKNFVADTGRSTGFADRQLSYGDNQGPLIRDNVLQGNGRNGMIVRGETLTTQSIWDDTDIVHIVQSEIYVPNMHTYGGIRLESSSNESLVVKLSGPNAGFTAGGSTLDITDRIGGMLHLVGQPGQPVVLTSLSDDTVGAGYDLQGLLQKDTNGNGASFGASGDWRGVRIDRYSHDRNVSVYVENEIADRQSADTNSVPEEAEFIGSLAEKQHWGDENLRLGIDLQGFIDSPGDVDVYSFSGVAGSQVWIDIDRTTHGLDTVVELIDSNGVIQAQSDNYYNEKAAVNTWQVFTSAAGDIQANGLDFSRYLSDDHYSTNSLDAGFRVVLPGTAGVRGKYWVRVRSSNIDSATATPVQRQNLRDNSRVANGLTSGVYQLQVRLQEGDEFAGTTIQYTDIRFATVGIQITGQPIHGPLVGESEEVEGTTGQLGNLMNTDRAALAVRGRINSLNDVDAYQFEVNYQNIQQAAGVSLTAPHVPVVFDLDYADGLARADLTMAIYDSAGRLILLGRDSNITDDQSGPQEGTDTDDLTRGSVGTFDPFVGAVELPGGTYTLRVFNNRQMPAVMDQFFNANSANPLLRVEPVNSVKRLFEERFGSTTFTSAEPPIYDLFSGGSGLSTNNAVPYTLGDIVLFVSNSGGTKGVDETTIRTINPFTGALVTTLGSFAQSSGDIAMRPDGQLYTFSTGAAGSAQDNSGNTGNYLRIDTGTGASTFIGDDNITANLDNLNAADDTIVGYSNNGFRFQAITFTGTDYNNLLAIGDRFDNGPLPANSNVAAQYTTNVLYRFSVSSGSVNPDPNNRPATGSEAADTGAGTTQREIGQITTAPGVALVPSVTGMATILTGPNRGTYIVTDDGGFYSLNTGNGRATLRANFAGVNFTGLTAGPDEVEGGIYQSVLFGMTTTGDLMAFNTNGVAQPVFYDGLSVISTGINSNALGQTTGLAFSTLDRNLWGTTNNRGNNPGHGVERRFDDSVLSGREEGSTSLYFGNTRSGADAGNQNNLSTGEINNVNFPGGADGAVVSNEFSLQGYNRNDKPVLYFNYFLETENAAWNPNGNPGQSPADLMRDAFRVYITDGSGRWNLVSTNDSFRQPNFADEFDYGPDGSLTAAPTTQTFPDVIETFDNTGNWRQARIDLSNYAGRENLRLRFEFSTAGSFNIGDFATAGQELYAKRGSVLRDGETFIIDGLVEYEFDMGYTLVAPAATNITDGETVTIQGVVFEFDKASNGVQGLNRPVVIAANSTPEQIATALEAAIDAALIPTLLTHRNGNRVNLILNPAVNTFSTAVVVTQSATPGLVLEGTPGVAAGRTPVVVHSAMTSAQVANVIAQAMADNLLPVGAYREVDPAASLLGNNTRLTAQNLEALSWTTAANTLITDSTTIPHVTIFGTSNLLSQTDFYRFVVPANNSRVIVDLDATQEAFDSRIRILDNNGAIVFENTSGAALDLGDNEISSYLDVLLDAGTYFIQVGHGANLAGAAPEQPYALHLSVQGHGVNANGPAAVQAAPRSVIKTHNDMVRMIKHTVVDAGPLSLTTSRPGEVFGAYNTSYNQNFGNRPGSLRGMNNAVEGVYVDDIILGFAERGEMIINAAANTSFIQNEDVDEANYIAGSPYLGVDLGAYDVEIRRTSDYAETEEGSPSNILQRAIDTNDRNAELTSLTIPNSWRIADGSTITLSDGVNSVAFEFNQVGGAVTTPGAFPIPFDPILGETSVSLATKLRNAINGALVQSVLKIKASLSDGADSGTASTSSRLHLTGNAIVILSPELVANVLVETFTGTYGDQNHHRDQGQLIVRESSITDSSQFGIVADAAARGANPDLPGPGSVRNLHTINDEGLVTGVVIMNNVIAANQLGGIRFSGDQAGGPAGPVPYGRIINNTIVGITGGGGTGILVEQSASPTILNNIIADFATGINVDLSSVAAGTTIGSSLYSGNVVNSTMGLGAFPIVLVAGEALFVDKANRNYYPAPNSRAIDSSLTSLGDRDAILRVKQPMDLDGRDDKGSPIIAPEFDLYGQLRGNDPDVETPAGQGASVLFDRGAIDRVDFARPQALLVFPEDQSLLDGDADTDEVWIDQVQTLRQFRVRLFDEGIGIDDRTVDKSQFVLKRVLTDGVTEVVLVEGVDYTFAYNEVTKEAILTAATFFANEDTEVRYILLVDNDGLSTGDTVNGPRDLAGNYLLDNRADGTTRFDIVLTDGVNDAPSITAPATATMQEDSVFTFANGSLSVFDQDAHLGTNVLTVTLTALNGVMSLGSIPTGLTINAPADGLNDAAITMTGRLQLLNTALNNLTFAPTLNYFGAASITIVANDLGEFSGPAAQSPPRVINITVTPVNDAPTFNPIAGNPPTVIEDALGVQTVSNFLTGISAGPANEVGQTLTASVNFVSFNSLWGNGANKFFAVGGMPTITISGSTATLTYKTAPDVNGSVTLSVQLNDGQSANNLSVLRTFVITVTPVNDAPVNSPRFATGVVPPRVLVSGQEDASLVNNINVPLVYSFGMGPATALDEVGQSPLWTLTNYTRTSGNLVFDFLQIRPDGSVDYRARKDTAGTATFNVLLQDIPGGIQTSASATPFSVTITIAELNDTPVAVTGNYVVDEGYSLNLDASGSFDVDAPFGDTLTYAWDLNNDGDYTDAGEAAGSSPTRVITWQQLVSLGITAPSVRTIKLRVTDSRNQSNSTVVVNAALTTLIVDYGDAPNSYGTLKGSNGAAHTITGNLTLGMTRDKETNGQPGPNANLDGADEDGVTFPTTLEMSPTQALPAYVDVYSSGVGKLDIWLDLNRNGVFDHNATEHLGNRSWPVKAGVNRIFFTIPAGTPNFATMMRFRLTSQGHAAVLPTGRANDGEVEDYIVHVRPVLAAVSPVINRPVDFNTADAEIAQTTDSTPTIAWSLHAANFKYELIIRNASNQIVYSRLAASNFTATSDTVTSSLPAGIYTVHLTAFNKAGVAATTSVRQFRVVKVAVSSPTGSLNSSRPTIVWNHVPGTKSYTVEIYGSPSNVIAGRHTVPATSFTTTGQFTLPGNLPLGTYYVRVQATDAADLPGDWSANQFFNIRTAPVVLQPQTIVLTPVPVVSWTPVTGAASYDLQLFNMTDNTLVASVTGVQGTSWSSTSPLSLARYRVMVTARSASGFSGVASTPFYFTYSPVPKIVAPGGRLADSTPTFGWEAVPSANLYRLVVRQDFGSFLEVYRHNSLTGTFHELPFSLPLGRYTFSVVAVNTAAAGTTQPDAISSKSLETTFAVVTPPTVLGLQGTSGPVATTFLTRPTVLWTNPPQTGATARSQLLLFRRDGTTNVLLLNQSGITGTSFQLPTLGLGTYVVQVRTTSSSDPATVSDWSIERTFRVTVPPTLVGPTGAVTDATPTLNWSGVTGGQTYQIEVTRLPGNVVAFARSGLNALNYTVPSNLPIGRYQFRVQARSAFGELSSWSETMAFQVVGGPSLTGPASSTFNTRPSFSWTNMSGNVGGSTNVVPVYDFRLDLILPNNVPQVGFRTANGLTSPAYTIPTALPAGRYRAMVLARTSDTTSNFSNVVEFIVGGNPVVNAIGSTADTTPTISWRPVDGASGYQVFIALDNKAPVPDVLVQQLGIGSLSFTPTVPLAKGRYRAWVRAVNASNGQLSGPALTDAPSIIFTIVDASESQSQKLPGQYTMASFPVNMDDVVSESTISMLPAFVSGSQPPVVVVSEQSVDGSVQLKASSPAQAENAVEVAPESVPQTDEVLSQWGEQKWWDAVPAAVVVADVAAPEAEPVTSASSGILGALLALAPRSLRRRKKDESAK
jgi:hypothetical protein